MSNRTGPFFSVLITAYNRAQLAERCVRSCIQQTFPDFEIVVVDDASTDDTAAVLEALGEQRLRVVRHERNQGYIAARATAVDNARGQWVVILDSDDELLPHALARFRTLIDELPDDVRIIRSRHRFDDGRVAPDIIPSGITDYHGRLVWLETVTVHRTATDAAHCMHRSIFETMNYFRDRRGVMEGLWELELARRERSLWVPDVLSLVHADAPNRHSGGLSPRRLIPRLLSEAPDQMWMAETMLAQHGDELSRVAPLYRRWVVESAAQQAFLAGDRLTGIRHTRAALRAGSSRAKLSATLVLGLLGPWVLAYVKAAGRDWRTRRATPPRRGARRWLPRRAANP
jgi:Glycosyl transferase family 2